MELNQEGIDNGLFFVSLNDGLEEESLKKAASGGETSRLLLALKSVLNNLNPYNCLIFDEIDTGISGRTAQKVAEKMAYIGRSHQVLCITHLPQIAAYGEQHIKVYKQDTDKRTETHIRPLTSEERITEIATMLSGNTPTPSAIKNAQELITAANK